MKKQVAAQISKALSKPKLNRPPRPLDIQQLRAARMIAMGRQNPQIVKELGIKTGQVNRWRAQPKFKEEVAKQEEIFKQQVRGKYTVDLQKRVEQRENIYSQLKRVVRARQKRALTDPQYKKAGGASGFIVREVSEHGAGAHRTKKVTYAVDNPTIGTMLKVMREQSEDLGQLVQKNEVVDANGNPVQANIVAVAFLQRVRQLGRGGELPEQEGGPKIIDIEPEIEPIGVHR